MLSLVVTCNSFEVLFQVMFGLLCVKSSSLLVIGVLFCFNVLIFENYKNSLRTLATRRIANLGGVVIYRVPSRYHGSRMHQDNQPPNTPLRCLSLCESPN